MKEKEQTSSLRLPTPIGSPTRLTIGSYWHCHFGPFSGSSFISSSFSFTKTGGDGLGSLFAFCFSIKRSTKEAIFRRRGASFGEKEGNFSVIFVLFEIQRFEISQLLQKKELQKTKREKEAHLQTGQLKPRPRTDSRALRENERPQQGVEIGSSNNSSVIGHCKSFSSSELIYYFFQTAKRKKKEKKEGETQNPLIRH